MDLLLTRFQFTETETIGQIEVDGEFECYTLEDASRPGQPKIYGKTAIPEGRYRVVITRSQRFKRKMPLLLNVPGFDGIRIHGGTTHEDTKGCILVGKTKGLDYIGESRTAFDALYRKLDRADDREFLFITIKEQRELQYQPTEQ